jgi:hypothetical protein
MQMAAEDARRLLEECERLIQGLLGQSPTAGGHWVQRAIRRIGTAIRRIRTKSGRRLRRAEGAAPKSLKFSQSRRNIATVAFIRTIELATATVSVPLQLRARELDD